MILLIDSDATYLIAAGSKICTRGFFYLGNKDESIINGSILYFTKIIKNVMASAAEAEVATLIFNTRLAIPLYIALIKMGHSQSATKIVNGIIKQNKAKTGEIKFYFRLPI